MGRRFQLFHPTLLGLSLLLVFTTGCVNKLRMTEPTRSLGEQLLVSTSIDRSLSELDAEAIGRLKARRARALRLSAPRPEQSRPADVKGQYETR